MIVIRHCNIFPKNPATVGFSSILWATLFLDSSKLILIMTHIQNSKNNWVIALGVFLVFQLCSSVYADNTFIYLEPEFYKAYYTKEHHHYECTSFVYRSACLQNEESSYYRIKLSQGEEDSYTLLCKKDSSNTQKLLSALHGIASNLLQQSTKNNSSVDRDDHFKGALPEPFSWAEDIIYSKSFDLKGKTYDKNESSFPYIILPVKNSAPETGTKPQYLYFFFTLINNIVCPLSMVRVTYPAPSIFRSRPGVILGAGVLAGMAIMTAGPLIATTMAGAVMTPIAGALITTVSAVATGLGYPQKKQDIANRNQNTRRNLDSHVDIEFSYKENSIKAVCGLKSSDDCNQTFSGPKACDCKHLWVEVNGRRLETSHSTTTKNSEQKNGNTPEAKCQCLCHYIIQISCALSAQKPLADTKLTFQRISDNLASWENPMEPKANPSQKTKCSDGKNKTLKKTPSKLRNQDPLQAKIALPHMPIGVSSTSGK